VPRLQGSYENMATHQELHERNQASRVTAGTDGRRPTSVDALATIILFITIFAFLPTLGNGFSEWDEKLLVENPHFRGWGWPQIVWAFKDVHTASYQPVAWLTFNVDYLFWGMDPFGFHLTNLIVHAMTALLLYFLCLRLLSFLQPDSPAFFGINRKLTAGFAALVFGIHPLRVESVALAAARPDLLCGFFLLISILSYLHVYGDGRDRRRTGWMILCVLGFGLSMLASVKGLVLPFILLLLDIYPLRRIGSATRKGLDYNGRQLLWQKLALIAFGLVVVLLPRLALYPTGEPPPSGDHTGLTSALGYLLITPGFYLWKSIVPLGFSLHYEFPVWSFALTVLGLAVISGTLFYYRARFPALLTSWLGYLILILPGLATSRGGLPLVSDGNSYLPGIPLAFLAGLALLACIKWLARSKLARQAGMISGILATCIIIVLASVTWSQTRAWFDTETVLRNSAAAGRSASAHFNLAVFLQAREKSDDAVTHYRRAAAIAPSRWDAHEGAGVLLYNQGRVPEALPHLRIAVANNPNAGDAREKLASSLVTIGQVGEAIQHFRKVLEISPTLNEARLKLATILALEGHLGEATSLFEQAVEQEPGDAKIHSKLGEVLAAQGKLDAAIQAFRRALQIQPMDAEFHENLGRALTERGFKEEGAKHLQQAIRILRSTPAER
jgi:Tfp pilus assembly protein PilF